MLDSVTRLHGARQAGVTLLLLAGLGIGSCAKKITGVDPSFAPPRFPEGIPSPSQLVVWQNAPNLESLFVDNAPPGAGPEDYPPQVISFTSPGVVRGMIFDYTRATGFQVFRREASGGYRQSLDFIVRPARLWLETQSEVYAFRDDAPGRGSASYIARGVFGDVATRSSPLTNTTELPLPSGIGILNYTGDRGINDDDSPDATFPDSLFRMAWDPVPGAGGYWLHAYTLDIAVPLDVQSGIASPISMAPGIDYLVAYMPASTTAYRLGDPLPPGGRILYRRLTSNGIVYRVRISAVDTRGRLLATTPGSVVTKTIDDLHYARYRIGAVKVNPHRRPTPSPGL